MPTVAESDRSWSRSILIVMSVVICGLAVSSLHGQTLRLCVYNMLDRPTTAAQDQDMRVIMQAVGNTDLLGNSQAVDILAFQEGPESASEYDDIEANMEAVFGGNFASSISSPDFFGCRTGFVYNSDRVQLLAATTLTGSLTHNTRRGLFRPIGGTNEDDFYIYSIHLKAGNTGSDVSQRAAEATILRNNVNTLPNLAVIYCGDFNLTGSDEPAYQNLFAPGDNGSAVESLNTPFGFRDDIEWQDNIAFLPFHTQNPTNNMDDRFDAIYLNGRLVDGQGIEYVRGSCSVLGNNGTHNLGSNINTGSGAPGFGAELVAFSDHLPVFCDLKYGQTAPKFNSQLAVDAVVSRFVRTTGPVTGTTGNNEMQIEGSSNPTTFQAFGVVDFDLSGQLPAGQNAATASNVVLNLFQDNAAFTDNGPISVYLASSAATQVTIDNTIQYQTNQDGLASIPSSLSDGAIKVATYAAVHEDGGLLPDGTLDPIALFGSAIEQAVADALNNDGLIRLLITPDHAQTAATFTGFASVLGSPNLAADLVLDDGSADVLANQFTIVNGTQGAGSIMATQSSDDLRLNYFSAAPTASDPPLRVQASGVLPIAMPQTLSITLESLANTPNVLQSIELFNFSDGNWEEVDATLSELSDNTIETKVAGDVSRFVGPGNLVLTRLSWTPAGPVLFFPWSIGIDQFKWTVMP